MGLTLSAQRGARVNNAIIEFELKQGNLNERAQAWWGSLTKGEAFAPDVRLRIKQEAKIIRDLALQRAQQGMQAYGGTRAFPTLQDEEGDRVTVTFPGNPTPQTIPRSALDEAKSKYKAVEVGQPQPLSPPPR